ncbi:MAG: hypothetical protein HY901_04710 [Deltaproteobacteria bacterium]|nr:hypothetical protein [Deltaproteobacteria bacterium]
MTVQTWITLGLTGLVVLAALWTVLTPNLLRSAIGLALTSALLTLVMFQMDAPLAGVFELSVCAGLITVVFISAISVTRSQGEKAEQSRVASRARAFLPLLGVAAWVGVMLWSSGYVLDVKPPPAGAPMNVRDALWSLRRLDLLGQLLVIFVGVFGVVILFKEKQPAEAGKEAVK